jgi:hypothetical protein
MKIPVQNIYYLHSYAWDKEDALRSLVITTNGESPIIAAHQLLMLEKYVPDGNSTGGRET